MDWSEAKKQIEKKIQVGTDVNSKGSKLRKILRTNYRCDSSSYGYNGEKGFLVRISNYEANNLKIPWSMLEYCFIALKKPEGYNNSYFIEKYPLQYKDHDCHVHVVGAIFEKSGIAYEKDNAQEGLSAYFILDEKEELMNVEEYENKFFETAKRMGYEIEICKGGPFRGERQIDFGNKKLHAGHIRKLYPLVKESGSVITSGDFEKLIRGRPCAVPYFNEINKEIFKEKTSE